MSEFCPTRHADGAGPWLYRMSSDPSVPKDRGYYIGYRIAEEFVSRSLDRDQAVIDLLVVRDSESLLQASGYCDAVTEAR